MKNSFPKNLLVKKLRSVILITFFTLIANLLNGQSTPLTEGPGGVTSNLELWLKANDGAGTIDNQALSTWYDQANTNNAH